ncbi:hypothetical protein HDV00_006708 [Rhizophlyctis rosea]|nr:hypothetical protein HDV00_006708 [Rhizophlyctis rosea]
MNTTEAIKHLMESQGVEDTVEDIIDQLESMYGPDRTPRGLTVKLMRHQVEGLAWLIHMEQKQNGGILADDMGLGKTIQTLALLVKNRAPINPRRGRTLIVAPLALLTQWQNEILDKTECAPEFKVLIYHGSRKNKTKRELREYDIDESEHMDIQVLTTYGTLANEVPLEPVVENGVLIRPAYKGGPLFRAKWHRVVLDEAQYIKNHRAKASLAVAALDAVKRICLSGTPIQNSADEAYSYFRFIQLPNWSNYNFFRERIGKLIHVRDTYERDAAMKTALKRLQVVLRTCLLRRTKTSKDKNGEPILRLCPRIVEMVQQEFTAPELDFYHAIETASQLQFAKYMKAGTVVKNYANILVLLLRLRQACCHPHLIHFVREQYHMDNNPRRKSSRPSQSSSASSSSASAVSKGKGTSPEPDIDPLSRARNVLSPEVFARLLTAAKKPRGDGNLLDDTCPICTDVLDTALVGVCGHPFCKDCLEGYLEFRNGAQAGEEEEDEEGVKKPCPMCREMIGTKNLFDVKVFTKATVKTETESRGKKGKEPATEGGEEEEDEKKPVIDLEKMDELMMGLHPDGNFNSYISSTKLELLMTTLHETQEEDPNAKTIVFSQWTTMLDLTEEALRQHGFRFCRYDGTMNADKRQRAVNALFNDDSVRVMLISLKCGGVGLNLTRASRVVLLDLWWNPAVEDQAIDRVHRIGQMADDVRVVRLAIPGTVEDRILTLQERKRKIAAGALGDGDIQVGRLSVEELAYLFQYDENRDYELQGRRWNRAGSE